MYKQVILIRRDLEMTRGKIAAQACHASLEAYRKAVENLPEKTEAWLRRGGKKVVLWAEDLEQLEEIENELPNRVPVEKINDAGMTELEPGTSTALGIGPWEEKKIDKYTGDLKTVK